LRSRCQELDGEAKAARDEAAGLRRRVAALAAEKAPTLVDLVAQAVAEERAAFEAQSLKALLVLEAKDAVLASREREVAEARAECGAAQSTLAATRRELDACERRLIATLDEQGKLRAEVASLVDSRDGAERRTRETVSALKAEIDALRE
jgi:chromosome segregation ATPase